MYKDTASDKMAKIMTRTRYILYMPWNFYDSNL
jgi:hypothetical protein